MKKILLSLAAVALMMSACTQDVAEPGGNFASADGKVSVTATFSPETRTAMAANANGGLDITWVAGDAIGLFGEDATSTIGTNAEYTATTAGKTSGFAYAGDATAIAWGQGTHTFYAYYPYTAEGSDYTAVPASIPAVQIQSAAGNLDHLQPYSFLYAACEANQNSNGGNIDLQFQNVFSILELAVCAEEGSVDCEALIFRAIEESEIVSAEGIKVNLTDGSLDYSAATTSNEIQVKLGEGTTLTSDEAQKFYMMITPGHGGQAFQAIAVVGGEEVVLGALAVHESGIPAGVKAALSLNVPAPEEPADPIDLSAAGTSNCYIVNQANTTYKFKATVKGNGVAALGDDVVEIAPTKARLLWAMGAWTMAEGAEDGDWPRTPDNSKYALGDHNANQLISFESVTLEDGYVTFTTGKEMPNGNAVIIATDDSDNVLWSWHIWALNDYNVAAEDKYVTTHGLNVYMMDRNIGATSDPSDVANPTIEDWIGTRGLYYQWGRKDPFYGSIKHNGFAAKLLLYATDGTSTNPYAIYGSEAAMTKQDVSGIPGWSGLRSSIDYATANPMKYISAGSSNCYAWIGTEASTLGTEAEWGKLWGNQEGAPQGGIKTMYDPCPVGYSIPAPGKFAFITSHNDDASAYYNHDVNWKYNTREIIFGDVADEDGKYSTLTTTMKVQPYGLNFYIHGAKTPAEVEAGAQNYGIEPEDKTVAYFPCTGCLSYGFADQTTRDDGLVTAQTNAPAPSKGNADGGMTYFMSASYVKGDFYRWNRTSMSYGEQMGKAMPVRCFRENEAVVTPEPEPEPEPEVPAGIDLSADGSANCYVVNTAGAKYKFKANVKGNGYDPITGAVAEAINLDGANPYIFWGFKKTTGDGADNTQLNASILRESVKIEGDYITFETPAEMLDGNVGIAVADASGNIMWSWHIWCIQGYDYEASAVDVAVHDMNYKIMDRNLGAFSNPAAIENPTEEDYAYAHGMYYQWGRKDPFLCGGTQYSTGGTWFDFIKNGQLVKSPTFSIKGDGAYNYNDFIAGHGLSDFNEILAYSAKNPLQFFTGSNWATTASSSNGQNDDWGKLWGNQKDNYATSVKTMYDPCPVGYTVASPNHFTFAVSSGSLYQLTTYPTWELNTPNDIVEGSNVLASAPWGMYFYTKGVRTSDGAHPEDKTTVFLPKQRWIQNNGTIRDNSYICMYTNAPSDQDSWGGQPYKASIEHHGYAHLNRASWTYAAEAACALAVRCVSENK